MAAKKAKKQKMNNFGKNRIAAVWLACTVFLFLLFLRTAYIQTVKGEQYRREAVEQQTRDTVVNAKRGSILDRNGKVLAVSASVETVSVSPVVIEANKDVISPENLSKGLAEILGLEYKDVFEKVSMNKTNYQRVKSRIEKEEADKVRKFIEENNVEGVSLDADTKRYYPYGNFASHVIGFTGTDNQGLDGIELMYDKYLKGSAGRVIASKNAAGSDMPFEYEKMINAEDGLNVVLTIDETIQHIAEKYLEQAVVDNKLDNGSACILMDVNTGEVLAMATKPDYNLNTPFEIANKSKLEEIEEIEDEDERKEAVSLALQKQWRNKAVVDTYEPGSVFKMFTAAMALEENVVKLDDVFFCGGSKHVGEYDISCWKSSGHGSETFVQAVQNSCNPAFMEIGARIGAKKFTQYLEGFGFKEKTEIDLPGEAIGSFHAQSAFNEVELATSSFGQSFTVTPLQMITGASAIANGGRLMQPRIVKQLTDKNGTIVKEYPDIYRRQIVSSETSRTLCSILESVVSEGGGSGAYIKGFRVAGKTGTSEKLPRGNHKYIASFLGFAPADDPQIACLVILDEPMGGVYYGGTIAAPVCRQILEEVLLYLGVEPAYTTEEKATLEATVPDVRGLSVDAAIKNIKETNLRYSVEGSGETVISQIPKAGVKVNQLSTIMLYTDENQLNITTTVPDVTGCNVSSASSIISSANLNIKVIGAGSGTNGNVSAATQTPQAGTQVEIGTVVTVEFRRVDGGE